MASIVQYKGYRVLAGVKWTFDKTSLTVSAYPSRQYPKNIAYRLYPNITWVNKCPVCDEPGVLRVIGAKGSKTAVEGEINCTHCDTDIDAVQGYVKLNGSNKHLTKGSSSSKSSTSNTLSNIASKENTALNKVKSEYNTSKLPKKTMTLKIPPLDNIMDGYCHELSPPLVSTSMMIYVESVEITQTDITLTVNDTLEPPGTEYTPPAATTKTSSASAGNYTAGSDIEKKIMAVGKSLKASTDVSSINKIYRYLESRGSGGFTYAYYNNWPGGDIRVLNTAALAKHWSMKSGNCVWFAWCFYVMCQGAGVSVEIWHSAAHGNLEGHLWNRYKGKIWDCTHYTNHAFDAQIK
jgi:hypothetical protein